MITLENLLYDLRQGNYKPCLDYADDLNIIAVNLLNLGVLDNNDVYDLEMIIRICNILYNDTDLEVLPIEDGLYDLLLEKYKTYNPNFQVGAEVIKFNDSDGIGENNVKYNAISFMDTNKYNDMMYKEELIDIDPNISIDSLKQPALYFDNGDIKKRKHNIKHEHPDLVGTLDKCKFILVEEARTRGVENDSNVKILERDFFAEHIKQGVIRPDEVFDMVLELKYDGISVEADCSNVVESARSRGDTGIGAAADMTPILEGYPFPNSIPATKPIGLKFEAIMTHYDLMKFNEAKGKKYKNCRSAIVGLFGSGDAHLYRDYITLIPLQTDVEESGITDRVQEIEFLNKYYSTKGQPLRYAVARGDYKSILFQIHLFQQEAEYARELLPFMYDGIVVSYLDPVKRQALGRKNFINKYSMAVKFNPLKKQTHFRKYEFTVGQDGRITPMIYYDPVEFYGTIHPKSTGHSYERFCQLELRPGDVVDVEYVNDVMPYVTKPDNQYNSMNPNPPFPFIKSCPECGGPITISDSGKSAYCKNPECQGRVKARMVNMLSKLNLADFGEAAVKLLNRYHLKDIIYITKDELVGMGFGPTESDNFIDRMKSLVTDPMYDYQIIGSLGFTGVASKTWRLILNNYNIFDILNMYINNTLRESIVAIKGIGPITADTINSEMDYFYEDVALISTLQNIIQTKGVKVGKQIRFTGFRNNQLSEQLINMGHDADDNAGVTKSTDILLVPYDGYSSGSKLKKVGPGCLILSIDEFISNMDKYLQ